MQRFQVFTRHGGAGAAAQAKADFLLDMLPQDAAAQQEALRLYAGRLGGMDGFPPDVLEARLRADLWDGIFVAGYYVPDPGAVPMMPSPATDTTGLMADPAGTPQTWSVPQRIAAMLRRIPKNMPEAMRAQVAALLSPESIAALAIFFAVLAIAQFVGAGEVVDAILAALAWRLAGLAGFYALGEFVGEIIVAARATTLPAIETAAKNAAGDLVTLGVQFLSAVVLRAVAQGKMASAKAEPDPEPPPPPNTVSSRAAPNRSSPFGSARGPAADDAEAGSIRNVNPLRGNTNCVNCAAATDATLAGRPASALLSGPKPISALGKNWVPVSGPAQIGDILTNSGNGSRGIVYGASPNGNVGHVWNVINKNGDIQYVDGQSGGNGFGNFANFQKFQFLLTNPGGK
jgi:hypothetical protein